MGTGKSDKEKPSILFFSRFTRERVAFFEKKCSLVSVNFLNRVSFFFTRNKAVSSNGSRQESERLILV